VGLLHPRASHVEFHSTNAKPWGLPHRISLVEILVLKLKLSHSYCYLLNNILDLNELSPCIAYPEGATARDIPIIFNEINEVLKL
jgi:hypothetical protein